MDSEDGQIFVKNLAYFVRTHERALANALQLQRHTSKNGKDQTVAGASSPSSSMTTSLVEALSRSYLSFASHKVKPAKLTLTPHHLFYLLSKFEDLGVDVGPMTVRLENLRSDAPPANYISFLGHAPKSRGKQSDADSLRSVSSVRSVMSSMSSVWSAFTLSNSAAKAEKQMAQYRDDLKYLYSCFTKIPALRLSPDTRARLISGFEEFPFDTAVPLFAFKNVSSLEICDLDFRQFHGWDRMSEQLRSLSIKRAQLDDPIDLLQNIVLDDAEKRRKRSSKIHVPTTPSTPGTPWPFRERIGSRSGDLSQAIMSTPATPVNDMGGRRASLGTPYFSSKGVLSGMPADDQRQSSNSPPRPHTPRPAPYTRGSPGRAGLAKGRRSSGSSASSQHETTPRASTIDLLSVGILPPSKWRFLRHLSLAENGLTGIPVGSLAPVANTLQSLDLSGNLFSTVPEELASLTHLRALNLSNCMIDSLSSLASSPLPAINTLNVRSNRLLSLIGIERLFSLERVDLRDNRLHDPTELSRLTSIPDITDVYVIKNPFTRTHSNYRLTIFNLFRSTPGHLEDINIDTMGPLYHEKKYLVDRAPEPASKPVVRPPPEEEEREEDESHHHVLIPTNVRLKGMTEGSGHPGHRRATSDLGPRSTVRRKKAPRRRIVELTQTEQRAALSAQYLPEEHTVPELTELPPAHTPNAESTESDQPTTPEATAHQQASADQPVQRPGLAVYPQLDTSFSSSMRPPKIRTSSDEDNSPTHSPEDMGVSTDVYRQKIEALKDELGPNFLSALNEERLVESRARERSFSPASQTSTVRPDRPPRGVSVGGGRTLG